MKLFKYEGHRVVISPEALLLKPFKRIWERDRSETKNRALSELGYIYFFCDPRSDYMSILDDETRDQDIKIQEGLKLTWEPDKLVLEGMDLYRKLTVTTSAGLLEDAKFAVQKIRTQIRNMEYDGIDPEKMPKALKDAADTIARIPVLIESLQKAEKALNSEILENSRMRGQGDKKILEDGFE